MLQCRIGRGRIEVTEIIDLNTYERARSANIISQRVLQPLPVGLARQLVRRHAEPLHIYGHGSSNQWARIGDEFLHLGARLGAQHVDRAEHDERAHAPRTVSEGIRDSLVLALPATLPCGAEQIVAPACGREIADRCPTDNRLGVDRHAQQSPVRTGRHGDHSGLICGTVTHYQCRGPRRQLAHRFEQLTPDPLYGVVGEPIRSAGRSLEHSNFPPTRKVEIREHSVQVVQSASDDPLFDIARGEQHRDPQTPISKGHDAARLLQGVLRAVAQRLASGICCVFEGLKRWTRLDL